MVRFRWREAPVVHDAPAEVIQMYRTSMSKILIKNAKTNNLKSISLEIPHHQFIVVTGVSGSGKSSLAFDVIAREGQRRYFETMPSFARQFMGKLSQPDVESIEGLSPVIAIGQKTTSSHSRSTVGTLSDMYDMLRLLFARTGESSQDILLSRSLFSFNTEEGRCPQCNGIGKEEKIDLEKLVVYPEKTLREGALAPTLPTGYIMYSQVTIDVLDQVCKAEGFHVDIPWNQLTEEQKKVILLGSEKIKVPFGKHSLESRLKWTGIKAKPREEGFYKGMLPIMTDILRRDRNANILKYVSSVICSSCEGKRLNKKALNVRVKGKTIADVSEWEINELDAWIRQEQWSPVARKITQSISAQTELMLDLGVGHLKLNQSASTLSASEAQRIRVINQLTTPLSDVLYVLDEPSIGLHSDENQRMIAHLKALVKKGNTVIVVEHDLDTIRQADWIIDIGPKAGREGGELLFNGSIKNFLKDHNNKRSPTFQALTQLDTLQEPLPIHGKPRVELYGCHTGNLKHIDVSFVVGALNVVSGKSGSGTKALVLETLKTLVEANLQPGPKKNTAVTSAKNIEAFDACIFVDQSPIGRTPRSNPATYLGISDAIRDLFASLPQAKQAGFTKSRFSFNNKGGRCETCQGAGKTQIGMHFLGNVDIPCGTCGGDRFNEETLAINYKGKSIADMYQMSVNEALDFFTDATQKYIKRIRKGMLVLQEIGLGYLTLGQSSTTLSGGEAQRIKIANQLQKKDTGQTLYLLMEPSIGLHASDLSRLLQMFRRIQSKGNTIVCIEQEERIIAAGDWHIQLGPEGGKKGGELIFQGVPTSSSFSKVAEVKTPSKSNIQEELSWIQLHNVSTNGLKNVDVSFPKKQLSVVTGISGSGKTSLVHDTLFAEATSRFSASLSTYSRSFVQQNSTAVLDTFSGVTPCIALRRRNRQTNKRSTVGTLSGIYDSFRLLFARIAALENLSVTAQHFSFNHHLGACEQCNGYGVIEQCDPDQLITTPNSSIFNGALTKNKALHYYSNPDGQFMATLRTIANANGWDLEKAWKDLNAEQQSVILYGTGTKKWEVQWQFKNKSRSGTQELTTTWKGFCGYMNDEYERKRHNKNTEALHDVMHDVTCPSCHGSRLKPELLAICFLDGNIAYWSRKSIREIHAALEKYPAIEDTQKRAIATSVIPGILKQLNTLSNLGLSYLSLNRTVRSLSGGEYQRVLLSGQLASYLHGVTYVLDEPTVGLDNKQVEALVQVLRTIIANGNTVIAIEHDTNFISKAEYLVEMGPGAGSEGGTVVFQGTPETLKSHPTTLTYQLLYESFQPSKISAKKGAAFGIIVATANNLKKVDVTFYQGQFTVLTGVSGSGKTSLLRDVVYASMVRERPINCHDFFGCDSFLGSQTIFIDQQPLATNRLTVPASYLGLLDLIQTQYATSQEAKEAGLKKADFSFLSKKGKCATCSGYGKIKTSLDFMNDVWLHCETCHGTRYSQEVNALRLKSLSIGEVLQLTVQEAFVHFEETKLSSTLQELMELGLGHIRLGQPGNTLSGGEMQRLKLAKHLQSKGASSKLFLIDEPSTGLHRNDIETVLKVFQKIIDEGNTIICIDHNPSLIAGANVAIRLGPGSGEQGGEIVSERE